MVIPPQNKRIRVRMAPSPTGPLHIGTAWMTLFDFLFARHEGGTFILRIEDTDPERSKKEHEIGLIEGLHWLGLDWDEGPEIVASDKGQGTRMVDKGNFGPYRDSERVGSHKNYIQKFLAEGKAYQCYCTKEELDAQRKKLSEKWAPASKATFQIVSQTSEAKGIPFRYPGTCRNLTAPPAGKTPQVIRLKMPEGVITFTDLIRGEVSFRPEDLDDFAIARSDGSPLYNFSVVINDYEMQITHVVRGEDHISNTPKQIAVFMALGVPPPQYAHVPLILNPDRSKMSKRFGDTTVAEYRAKGYLPAALINFLVLLGWHPKDEQEIFSMDEMIEKFELSRVRKSGAIFDQAKLDWMNREYLKKMSDDEIAALLAPMVREENIAIEEGTLKKLIAVERGRANTLRDFLTGGKLFFALPEYDAELLVWQKNPQPLTEIAAILTELSDSLQQIGEGFIKEEISKSVNDAVQGRQKGEIFWPLRVAVSGEKSSPDPIDIMNVLGKTESLRRIALAIEKCKA